MMYLCVLLFNMLQMVVSFERCLEYSELPAEPDLAEDVTEEKKGSPVAFTFGLAIRWQRLSLKTTRPHIDQGVLPNVLSNVTFTVLPMEKVGVVGRTGAGKSSLVLALLRVLKPSEGRILIDGFDIADVPLKKLRSSITVIPQDPSLLRGTLRHNLDPTNSYSDEQIWKVLGQVHLVNVVSSNSKRLLLGNGRRWFQPKRGPETAALFRRRSGRASPNARCSPSHTACTRFSTTTKYLSWKMGEYESLAQCRTLLDDPGSAFHAMAFEAGVLSGEDMSSTSTTAL
ncbi:hypothetical protein MRX96_032324 [Rhipicephalus microplus]